MLRSVFILLRQINDSPIVGPQEQRFESSFVQLKNKLNERSQGVLFNLSDVLSRTAVSKGKEEQRRVRTSSERAAE